MSNPKNHPSDWFPVTPDRIRYIKFVHWVVGGRNEPENKVQSRRTGNTDLCWNPLQLVQLYFCKILEPVSEAIR